MAYFCSRADLEILIGKTGVDLRLDDVSATTVVVNQSLEYATQTIRYYTDQQYLHTDLYGNDWVTAKAVVIAANYFSQRRGNPDLFSKELRRIYDQLEEIKAGSAYIPDAFVMAQQVPSVRNQRVNHRNPDRPLQIDRQISTGGGYSGEVIGPAPGYY